MKPLNLNTIENPGTALSVERPEKVDGDGFGEALKTAIGKVDALQNDADL